MGGVLLLVRSSWGGVLREVKFAQIWNEEVWLPALNCSLPRFSKLLTPAGTLFPPGPETPVVPLGRTGWAGAGVRSLLGDVVRGRGGSRGIGPRGLARRRHVRRFACAAGHGAGAARVRCGDPGESSGRRGQSVQPRSGAACRKPRELGGATAAAAGRRAGGGPGRCCSCSHGSAPRRRGREPLRRGQRRARQPLSGDLLGGH